ncbi:hypothetical protein GCM10010372_78800 [Streptomyces tauricus]|nr:hypothetical protein GCM10010372_78800 [Streptomyces tauricus]
MPGFSPGSGAGPPSRAQPAPGQLHLEFGEPVLSFTARDHSPVLRAFLDTIRKNCPDAGAALNDRLRALI